MKKMFSLMLCFAMALSLMAVPAGACTISGLTDDGEPNIIPCEEVEQNGYCSKATIGGFDDTLMTFWGSMPNPYYKAQSTVNKDKVDDNGHEFIGSNGDSSDVSDILQPIDEFFRDFVNGINRKAYADIIDYENMTIEYVDKNGKPTGYKTVVTSPDNSIVHYDPDGNRLTGNLHKVDWTAENPFAACTSGTSQSTGKPATQTPAETPKPTTGSEVKHFDDVPANAWYAEAVNALAASGALKGYDDGLFHPENNVTIGELAVIIYRLATGEEPVGKTGYPDNAYSPLFGNSNHWAAYAIEALYSRDVQYILKMSNRADEPATRGDAISTVYTLAAVLAGGHQNLTVVPEWDFSSSEIWPTGIYKGIGTYEHYTIEEIRQKTRIPDIEMDPTLDYGKAVFIVQDIMMAYKYGIVHGTDEKGTCNPLGNLTRAELCQMLYNAGITQFTKKADWTVAGSYRGHSLI